MKTLLFIVTLSLCQVATAQVESFSYKIYTPEVVVDQVNQGPKGAVQLLWQKNPEATRYEVEVSNGKLVYSQVGEKHFHHVMLYFDKSYQWRVREVSAKRTTDFSPWKPLKVVKAQGLAQNSRSREPVSLDLAEEDSEAYVLDTGGGE